MALLFLVFLFSSLFLFDVTGLQYTASEVEYNLNTNVDATHPLDYSGTWENHTFNPSPSTWRFPFYVITLDRFIDGDPTNNDANNTNFENFWMTNQYRFGGDLKGLESHLDYLQGMGIKALYLTGAPFLNMPWAGDGYGPLDFTLLDRHHGTIQAWRDMITKVHDRDMYVVLDNTLATMGDLIGFEGYMNATAPFTWDEYNAEWKSDRRYHDFSFGNEVNSSCEYPAMWQQDGYPVMDDILDKQKAAGCRISDFDAYGDMKGVGEVPVYQSQLAKFASVQDRLRMWKEDVFEKIQHFSCLQIQMLDIDGFRIDKALQTPVIPHAEFSDRQRQCARALGKDNFLIVGEAVGEIPYTSVFIGRGRQPNQKFNSSDQAFNATLRDDSAYYLRDSNHTILDGSAFHYPTYGALTRFLGLDGPIGLEGVDFVQHWQTMLEKDDLVNGQTGEFDPRHMFGTTNQDVFRWPSLANGTHRQILGMMVTTLELPGIPMVYFGEEQQSYVLENLASNYVFGRTPMGSSTAWQLHGCYALSEEVYYEMPFDSAKYGCHDDSVSYNHLDPTHPMRSIFKRMFELRQQYQVLNDGWDLQTLSTKLEDLWLPGSLQYGIPSPTGHWSVYRGPEYSMQNFTTTSDSQGNQGVWFVFSNANDTVEYTFDCSSTNNSKALVAPFAAGTTVKSLFYPYDEFTLDNSTFTLGIDNSSEYNGCVSNMTMRAWGFDALVPVDAWMQPKPQMTKFVPGHDARLESAVTDGSAENVTIKLYFSEEMDCESLLDSITLNSTTESGESPALDTSSAQCNTTTDSATQEYVSQIGNKWVLTVKLTNVYHGIHQVVVNNASASSNMTTNAVDTVMFRVGATNNPVVFPWTANYTSDLLHAEGDSLYVSHKAPGADKWRYSTNFGSSWSSWASYTGGNSSITKQSWSGTSAQKWSGDHVMVQYWSGMAGSSEHMQHGDADSKQTIRRWPNAFFEGPWNEFGYDGGLSNKMELTEKGWTFELSAEWPQNLTVNVWGMDPNGSPDKTMVFGDVDGDGVLDLLPPDSLALNELPRLKAPGMPHTSWKLTVNDGTWGYQWHATGSAWIQIILFLCLILLPILTGWLGVLAFWRSFYQVKHNKIGFGTKFTVADLVEKLPPGLRGAAKLDAIKDFKLFNLGKSGSDSGGEITQVPAAGGLADRRTVLIATMEYEIEDWNIRIKIGGLGVMANLMGKNLGHQDLIWVVPCAGGIDYPIDTPGDPMYVKVLGNEYTINVQYHQLRNITFVLLDAPVFRQQTKAEPYPARMDDLDSAIYYSAWNACIAEAINRFPTVDLYHINDYHGSLAPLYLLPRVIPVCLSLHNAEFQGLWPIRNDGELSEISAVFNLDKQIIKDYVQFGEVFNLLHAGASYLRLHQKGFGAVGVSKKYGKRSLARYPIFWGLSNIGALPNPDPSDKEAWDKNEKPAKFVDRDQSAESKRGQLRVEAQKWAGLTEDPTAELFVFVGRWSMQKGVDAIADVFPAVLEKFPKVQLIAIGPVIDLYGKFAALKLAKLMEIYPGRVFSKPEFTQLPPCIFSGAEFALIPSRDEPFGLVAVEFGRKGALGVGARVGGLGQMPGWWYTVESTSTQHLIRQFKSAIKAALASDAETRADMRAYSAVQRFPVAQWVAGLETLQGTSIRKSEEVRNKSVFGSRSMRSGRSTAVTTAVNSAMTTVNNSPMNSPPLSRSASSTTLALRERPLGRMFGPGHDNTGAAVRPPISRPISRSASVASSLNMMQLANDPRNEGLRNLTRPPMPPIPNNLDSGLFMAPRTVPGGHGPVPMVPERFGADPGSWFQPDAPYGAISPSIPGTPTAMLSRSPSMLSVAEITRRGSHSHPSGTATGTETGTQTPTEKFNLEKVDPFFTDSNQVYYRKFDRMLNELNSSNSEKTLCIEDYLQKSSKDWFHKFHMEKLGADTTKAGSDGSSDFGAEDNEMERRDLRDILGSDYVSPTGIRNILSRKIGDWPVYSFLLAIGQILAANSYQITLLAGKNGQKADELYSIASIYFAGTVIFWILVRTVPSLWVLSTPFLFYGLAFFFIGVAPWSATSGAESWVQNIGTGFYSLASSSGSLFFALNFGTEGGTTTKTWTFRACMVQGIQQIYVAVLWLWGDKLSSAVSGGGSLIMPAGAMLAMGFILAIICFTIGILLFLGLPNYYRAAPGSVPSLYQSVYRRKIIGWFFIVVIIQNFFMSTLTGRNWKYLFSSTHAPTWAIFLLMLAFFIGVWAAMLRALGTLSVEHSWIFPIFAISLGAPRWAQILWATSGIGYYLPWCQVGGNASSGASLVASAIVGRMLWLWLGVLDALQGIGYGMILMQTLTRTHLCFSLMGAQAIGSVATMVARAAGPDSSGPGWVFPNLANSLAGLGHAQFWICLILQCCCCVGFFKFFRKEQLFKP